MVYLGGAALQLVVYPALEELLVGDPHLDSGGGRDVFFEPGIDERDIL